MSSAASESLLLERVRRVCRQLPASECPGASGLLLTLEQLQVSQQQLSKALQDSFMRVLHGEEAEPSGGSMLYARAHPEIFKA